MTAIQANFLLGKVLPCAGDVGMIHHVLDFNCDHVVAVAHGQQAQSPQVAFTLALAALAVVLSAARSA